MNAKTQICQSQSAKYVHLNVNSLQIVTFEVKMGKKVFFKAQMEGFKKQKEQKKAKLSVSIIEKISGYKVIARVPQQKQK